MEQNTKRCSKFFEGKVFVTVCAHYLLNLVSLKTLVLQPNESGEFPPLYTWEDDDSNTNCYVTAVKNFFECVSNGTGKY